MLSIAEPSVGGELHLDVLRLRVRGDVAQDLMRNPEDQRRAIFAKTEVGRQVEFGVGALALDLAQDLEQSSLQPLTTERRAERGR